MGKSMTTGERIRERRVRLGLLQSDLANRLEVSKSAIGNWEADRSRPDLAKVPELCRVLRMSLNEFYGMEAAPDGLTAAERKRLAAYRSLSERDRKTLDSLLATLTSLSVTEETKDNVLHLDDVHRVYMNELCVSAGPGETLLSDSRGSYLYLHLPQLTYRRTDEAIRVNGDSMEPTYHNGDLLLVHHQEELNPGEIGVFVVDGTGYVKEYRPEGLHSHNPKYPLIRLGEGNDVRCVGRVIGRVEREQLATEKEIASLEERKGGGRPTVKR